MRRRILIALFLIAIPVLLLRAAILLLPAERIGAMAAGKAESALQRPVKVARIHVRAFPRPAIVLERVEIGGAAQSAKLAAAHRVELRPKLLPLLRRHVVIDEIVLDRPRMLVTIARDGTSNLPTFKNTDGKDKGSELRVRRVRVQDGIITYRDARNNSAVRLAGVNQQFSLSGPLTGGKGKPVHAVGELSIADIDANLPGKLAWPVRDVQLRVDHDLELDRSADRLRIERLQLGVQQLELQLAGALNGLKNANTRSIDLRVTTGDFDIAQLIASLPKSILAGRNGETLSGAAGQAALQARAVGRVGAGLKPGVAGVLRLSDVALARGKYGRIATDVNGSIGFSLDSIVTNGITGKLLGEPLRLAFNVHELASPRGRVTLQTALALGEVQKLGLFPEGTRGRGRIALAVTANGALKQPKDALLRGHVSLNNVELQTAALKKPMIVQNARIELEPGVARAKAARARIGRSDVALDFTVHDWLPYALGDSLRAPVVTFDARAAVFDVDEIFGVKTEQHTYSQLFFAHLANQTLDGKTASEAAQAIGLGMPPVPPIQANGRIRAARLVRGGVPFENVDVAVAARDGQLDVQAASFRMMGGGVELTGRLGLVARGVANDVQQPLVLDYKVTDLKAAQFIKRFTTFRDQITGNMLLAGSVRMKLDAQLLPLRESLDGAGTIAVADGEIVNWPLLRKLGERIGVARFDTLAFKDWNGRYRFAGAKILIDDSKLNARELEITAAGTVGFDGALDLGATVNMPQQWAARIPGAPAALLVKTVSDENGRVPVGARIGGSARQPNIALDMSQAGTRAASAAREAAQQEAKKVAARTAEKITDRILPRDTSSARDSTKSKLEKILGGGVKKLIRGNDQ